MKRRNSKKSKQKRTTRSSFLKNVIVVVLIFIAISGLYSLIAEQANNKNKIALSELVSKINSGEVAKIDVRGDTLSVTLTDNTELETKKEPDTALTDTLANYGVDTAKLGAIEINIDNPSGFFFWLGAFLPFLLPVLIIAAFFWLASRQMKSSSMQAFSFGKSKARIVGPDDDSKRITFKDVAGAKEAKEELVEVVDFLKHPKKFLDIGARIPKGVLLMGPPGSGKTLMARAVAGEANVPFFNISGSEFVELFVGVGASRVRDLFKEAKKAAPAIIFIDEIDAVGRHRGTGLGGGHDEREQTLNQILVEMDGFEPTEKLIIIAATNRPDVLDPALLRPGRFDRRVVIDMPSLEDRKEILRIHANGKPFSDEVDLNRIAERTPGFSGADLQNLMNESAIMAARNNRKTIEQNDLTSSIEKVMLGPERRSSLLTEEEKKITAYHEAGHALVASVLPNSDPVHKVTIVSRGRAAGYTLKLPMEEKHLHSRKYFLDELAVALGGYVTEQLIFGDVTIGSSNDLKTASDTARSLVTKYGMSEKIGPVSFDSSEHSVFLGKELTTGREYSNEVASVIDSEVETLMRGAYDRAKKVIETKRDVLDAIYNYLMEKETLERDEFNELIASFGITVKNKEEEKAISD